MDRLFQWSTTVDKERLERKSAGDWRLTGSARTPGGMEMTLLGLRLLSSLSARWTKAPFALLRMKYCCPVINILRMLWDM